MQEAGSTATAGSTVVFAGLIIRAGSIAESTGSTTVTGSVMVASGPAAGTEETDATGLVITAEAVGTAVRSRAVVDGTSNAAAMGSTSVDVSIEEYVREAIFQSATQKHFSSAL